MGGWTGGGCEIFLIYSWRTLSLFLRFCISPFFNPVIHVCLAQQADMFIGSFADAEDNKHPARAA